MHICEYRNLTCLLMHMHANIHMYICCLLQVTYMHGSVVCVHISVYIHMYSYAYEHYSHREKADKKPI